MSIISLTLLTIINSLDLNNLKKVPTGSRTEWAVGKDINKNYISKNINDMIYNNIKKTKTLILIYKNYIIKLGILLLILIFVVELIISDIDYLIIGYNILNNLLLLTGVNSYMKNLIILLSIIYLLIIGFNISSLKVLDNIIKNNKWLSILVLINLLGLILLILINDLIMLFVVIELQSYSLYLLTSLYTESSNSIKSGLYYFIIGSIGSFIILDGTVSIYEDIGLTNISYILLFIEHINLYYILIIIFGLFIKIGVAPFYNYLIIIYTLVPTIITKYISLMPKLSILTLILSLVSILNLLHNNITNNIFNIISIFIIFSMLIGSIGGINVIKLKTLLGYSSLLNVSYILLGIISYNNFSLIAYLFYILQYSFTHINIFSIILLIPLYSQINLLFNKININTQPLKVISTTEGNNNNNNNNNNFDLMISKYSPIEYISQLKNLFIKNRYLSISLCISLFSLIGIPPLSGFYGKFYILVSSLYSGYILLSILLIIVSSISVLYYANIIKELSFDILNNFNIFKYKINNINNILFNKNNILNISSIKYIKLNNNDLIYVTNNISYIISTLSVIIFTIILQIDNQTKGMTILTYVSILLNN